MVARKFDTDTARGTASQVIYELFEHWRRFLTAGRDKLVGLRLRLFPPTPADAPARSWLLGRAVIALGVGALLVGVAVGLALAPTPTARTLAAWVGVQTLVWAVARWLLMRFATGRPERDASRVLGATSAGLIAYAFAVTPELRVVAWAASAAITWLALRELGDAKPQATRTVAIAWGAQALVVVGSWLARSAVMAVLVGGS